MSTRPGSRSGSSSQTVRNVLTRAITSVAMRRMLKPHANWQQFFGPFMAIYKAYPDTLRIDGVDTAELEATFDAYQSTAPDEAAAQATLTKIRGQRLQQAATLWTFMLNFYALCRAHARWNPQLKTAISDFTAFLKRSKSKSTPTTPSTTSTP